jgi:hypothetical protein
MKSRKTLVIAYLGRILAVLSPMDVDGESEDVPAHLFGSIRSNVIIRQPSKKQILNMRANRLYVHMRSKFV